MLIEKSEGMDRGPEISLKLIPKYCFPLVIHSMFISDTCTNNVGAKVNLTKLDEAGW